MLELKKKLKNIKKRKLLLKRLKLSEQKIILNNIALIMNQGYSLNECIKLLSYKMDVSLILDELSQGASFSACLKKLKFDNDILLIIEISENSGQLLQGINKSLKIIDEKITNKNGIMERLKYPMVLGVVLIGAIYFITNLLVPMFGEVYQNFGIEVGMGMKLFFKFLNILPKFILFFLGIIFLINFYMKFQEQSDILKFILKNRFIKKQYFKIYNQIFLVNLHSLLELGFRLDEIFEIFANQKYNFLLKKESQQIYKFLLEGEQLHIILKKRRIYLSSTIIAIEEGLKYNTLVANLKNNILLEDLKTKKKVQRYLFLIQPLFYLFFGIIIVLLYACIFVPMFKIMDSI